MKKKLIALLLLASFACKKKDKVEPVQEEPYTYKTSGKYDGSYKYSSITHNDTIFMLFVQDNHPSNTIRYRVKNLAKLLNKFTAEYQFTNRDYFIDIDESSTSDQYGDSIKFKNLRKDTIGLTLRTNNKPGLNYTSVIEFFKR